MAGVLRNAKLVQQLEVARQAVWRASADASRAYLSLAYAEAQVLLRAPDAALSSLRYSPREKDAWLELARTRWRARSLSLAGRAKEAQRERLAVASGTDLQTALIRLDQAIEAKKVTAQHFAAVGSYEPFRLKWLCDGRTTLAAARRLADEFPY